MYLQREMPWPVSNRELYICHTTAFLTEEKAALLIFRSINGEREKFWNV